ncbi:MAG: tRNA (adenosine(37)-N6)-threonylcarbamoyltransferase complex ATPase subunit type 1 TsaE [Mailhella sp.]|nr:tRNA (adenosine(37)-N6)-threonylcarbamoyltransferase complex ATPase subunit type 1 TsaE [Mailhella sp.]
MQIILRSLEDTRRFGALLAEMLTESRRRGRPVKAVYFFGGLGAGKTTLAAAMARALPGGENAEAASPSFTICNEYPTEPAMFHVDFYRLGEGCSVPDEVQQTGDSVLVAEWAENLRDDEFEPDRIEIRLEPFSSGVLGSGDLSAENGAENLDIFQDTCEKERSAAINGYGCGRMAAAELWQKLELLFPVISEDA